MPAAILKETGDIAIYVRISDKKLKRLQMAMLRLPFKMAPGIHLVNAVQVTAFLE